MNSNYSSDFINKYLLRKKLIALLLENRFIFRIFREVSALRREVSALRNLSTSCETNRQTYYRNFYVLDTNPLIIITSEPTSDLEQFSEIIGEKKAYIIKLFWWTRETTIRMYSDVLCHKRHQKKYPQHKVIFICNSEKEKKLANRFDLPSIYCNHNSLLDENIYTIKNNCNNKLYDVIYNARLDPIKRHFLLADVNNIGLILGPNVSETPEKRKYEQVIKSVLGKAIVINDKRLIQLGEYKKEDFSFPVLSSENVVDHLNEARVGVILSREEGACYASAEYLLCGLPVITTKNVGGRDVFLSNEYTKYVYPTPPAIKNAVEELIQARLDPHRIRAATLSRMEKHRNHFINLLQEIYDQETPGYNVKDNWGEIFVNKMLLIGQKWPDAFLTAVK